MLHNHIDGDDKWSSGNCSFCFKCNLLFDACEQIMIIFILNALKTGFDSNDFIGFNGLESH